VKDEEDTRLYPRVYDIMNDEIPKIEVRASAVGRSIMSWVVRNGIHELADRLRTLQ
jgi:hypothetical protein